MHLSRGMKTTKTEAQWIEDSMAFVAEMLRKGTINQAQYEWRMCELVAELARVSR